jgi:hypothetical protein
LIIAGVYPFENGRAVLPTTPITASGFAFQQIAIPLFSLAGDEVHKSIKFLFSLAPKGERESGRGVR